MNTGEVYYRGRREPGHLGCEAFAVVRQDCNGETRLVDPFCPDDVQANIFAWGWPGPGARRLALAMAGDALQDVSRATRVSSDLAAWIGGWDMDINWVITRSRLIEWIEEREAMWNESAKK